MQASNVTPDSLALSPANNALSPPTLAISPDSLALIDSIALLALPVAWCLSKN